MTDDAAIALRKTANVPLEWESNDFPELPLDRIEFTRRIVNILISIGYDVTTWNSVLDQDRISEEYFIVSSFIRETFTQPAEKNLTIALHQQFWRDDDFFERTKKLTSDPLTMVVTEEAERRLEELRPKTAGDLIEAIEKVYQKRWEQVHEFGVDRGAREKVLAVLFEEMARYNKKHSNKIEGKSKLKKFPAINDWKNGNWGGFRFRYRIGYGMDQQIHFPYLHPDQRSLLMNFMFQTSRLLKLPDYSLLAVLMIVSMIGAYIYCFGVEIWLIIVVPFSLWCGYLVLAHYNKRVWRNPNMTLGELADIIVESNCADYERMKG
jgi:hypothetical protein